VKPVASGVITELSSKSYIDRKGNIKTEAQPLRVGDFVEYNDDEEVKSCFTNDKNYKVLEIDNEDGTALLITDEGDEHWTFLSRLSRETEKPKPQPPKFFPWDKLPSGTGKSFIEKIKKVETDYLPTEGPHSGTHTFIGDLEDDYLKELKEETIELIRINSDYADSTKLYLKHILYVVNYYFEHGPWWESEQPKFDWENFDWENFDPKECTWITGHIQELENRKLPEDKQLEGPNLQNSSHHSLYIFSKKELEERKVIATKFSTMRGKTLWFRQYTAYMVKVIDWYLNN